MKMKKPDIEKRIATRLAAKCLKAALAETSDTDSCLCGYKLPISQYQLRKVRQALRKIANDLHNSVDLPSFDEYKEKP